MRIRYKPWARPELEASYFYENSPESFKGNWKNKFEVHSNSLQLELGCGKGNFISQIALNNPNINYIAIDLIDAMLGLAKRNVENAFGDKKVSNVILIRYDIEQILNVFSKDDKIEKIYINFCNPWPKAKHKKKRLTHINQLEKYKQILSDEGKIEFKTDDDDLFEDSIKYFNEAGFVIEAITRDLHKDKDENNIETEHEEMFSKEGIKIKKIIAKKQGRT